MYFETSIDITHIYSEFSNPFLILFSRYCVKLYMNLHERILSRCKFFYVTLNTKCKTVELLLNSRASGCDSNVKSSMFFT